MHLSRTASTPRALTRAAIMLTLIVAGEAIFLLPFVLARIFRPTFLDVFGLSNLQLGSAFSAYGVVALLSYFAGGPLADRFSARRLMAAALLATGAGGVLFARVPSVGVLVLLYGFWGLTTILLFWSALLRATRVWGGPAAQGRAYGLLDGGRGLFAAALASASVAIFAGLLPTDVASATLAQRSEALTRIILIFAAIGGVLAAAVWFVVPEGEAPAERTGPSPLSWSSVMRVARLPSVWLQAVIIVCAYAGYKSTDDFSLYARDAFGYDDVAAAQLGTVSFWVRPIAALGAGLLGDRVRSSRVITLSFGLLIAGSLAIGLGAVRPGVPWMLTATVAGTCIGIYALRGVYFAVFDEGRVPLALTGTAVGVVSVVGFSPDIFFGPLMGYLLDRAPGAAGHQHLFLTVAGFGLVGLVASLLFQRVARREQPRR